MRANYDGWISKTASLGAPGIDEIRWMRPVRPDDQLHFLRKTLNKRVSASRPDMGLIGFECHGFNAAQEQVFYQRHTQLVALRNPASPPARAPKAPSGATPAKFVAPTDRSPTVAEAAEKSNYFEDAVIGAYVQTGQTHFTRQSIIEFARLYDPQPFHLDDGAAARSHFGRLAASGWQTGSEWMGHIVRWWQAVAQARKSRGLEVAPGGPSPGFTNLRWAKPVFVDDVVTYGVRTVEKRLTSKKGWGLVYSHNTGVNQNGELVLEMRGCHFAPMKSGA
jgi:acyl dehydratase